MYTYVCICHTNTHFSTNTYIHSNTNTHIQSVTNTPIHLRKHKHTIKQTPIYTSVEKHSSSCQCITTQTPSCLSVAYRTTSPPPPPYTWPPHTPLYGLQHHHFSTWEAWMREEDGDVAGELLLPRPLEWKLIILYQKLSSGRCSSFNQEDSHYNSFHYFLHSYDS